MLKRLLRKIEVMARNRKEKQAKAARSKLEKDALHHFGWEIRCECGKLHNADKAGRVFAESDMHWHTICECGKKSKFLVGAPVLIADGDSDLKVLQEFYTLHEAKYCTLYSIVERPRSLTLTHKARWGDSWNTIKDPIVLRFYDYGSDDLVGETVYDGEMFSPTYYHHMYFCDTFTVSSEKYLVAKRFESFKNKDNREEHY